MESSRPAYTNEPAVLGNSIDINLSNIPDPEIRADVVVKQMQTKRIWGQVVDCDGRPIGNVLVKLVRMDSNGGRTQYSGVAHTISDSLGFYQFDLCANDNSYYRIIVSKAVKGGETVINTNGGNGRIFDETTCNNDPCCEQTGSTMSYQESLGNSKPQVSDSITTVPSPSPQSQYLQCNSYSTERSNTTSGKNYATYNNY